MSDAAESEGKKSVGKMIGRQARNSIADGKTLFSYLSAIHRLKSEVELLTSYSTDVIYRLRYDTMQYDYISPSIVKLLGYQPDEIKNLNLRSLIVETRIVTDGMRVVESFEGLEEARKKGDVSKWQADYLMQTKDGRRVWISDISYPWFDKSGAIVGSVGSLRDITDRIMAEQKVKEELLRLANTDSLTGLSSRRVFFTKLEEELRRMKRSGTETSILIIDIDRFKRINDTYGHAAGDQVLTEVSRIVSSCLRETDSAARLGAGEFGIVLPDTSSDGAYWVAERMRLAVSKASIPVGDKQIPVGCTISIGVATVHGNEETDSTRLYKIADTRLYIAKNTGRNQVSMDELVHMH